MLYGICARGTAKWLGSTCVSAIVLFHANIAVAACTNTSGAVICDTSAPNPSEPISGADILLLPGARVQQANDPYAGASVPSTFDTVTLFADGKLVTREGSSITNFFPGAASVNAGAGSTVQHDGGIGNTGTNGVGVQLGADASLTVGRTGALYASGTNGTAVRVAGTGASIRVDGVIGNAYNGAAIDMFEMDSVGRTTVGTADIIVGANGIVRTTLPSAIILSSGSSVDVAGIVRSEGAGSAIEYRGAKGGGASVTVEAGGVLQSRYQPAIVGSTGSLYLTIAGSVIVTDTPIAIQLGGADDTVNLVTGSSVSGLIDAGAGTDALALTGSGQGTLGATANFETANVTSGVWTLASPLQVANRVTISSGATAIGSVDKFASPITADGTLQIDQITDATFAGSVTGNGRLVKSGAGTLILGNQSFAGSTLISQGRISLAGSMPSAFIVARGSALAGQGAIRALAVQSGGLVAPGSASAIGTITVTGNYVQDAGATYAAKIAGSSADLIAVGGTATLNSGAILSVTVNGASLGQYTLLTANGGITGQFGTVTADIASAYSLSYNTDSVVLSIGRTSQGLLALAQGSNAQAVASAVLQLPRTSQLYTSLALANDAAVTQGFGQLAGDIYAAVPAAMIHGADLVSNAALKRTAPATGVQIWGEVLGSRGDMSGSADVVDVDQRSYGGLIGIEGPAGDVTIGFAGGYVHTRLRNGIAEARAKLPQALLYARTALGQVEAQAGVGYVRAFNAVDRTISFAAFNDFDKARYKANIIHGYGELGVPVKLGGGAVMPFAGGRFYRVKSQDLIESGGSAALRIDGSTHWSGMSELGTRLTTPVVATISAYGRVSWQHRFGEYDDPLVAGFVTGGSQFQVYGAQLSRDAAALGLGFGWAGPSGAAVTLGYDGRIGDHGHDNAGRVTLSVPL